MLHELALCAGYGGFSLALELAGVEHRTVCFVERDAYAAATLVARMADKTLDQAPVWDDLTTFDGAAWRGHVDLVTAGFPCQPFSQAGQRKGLDDDRWLWPDIERIVGDVRPSLVFLENVPGLVGAGLLPVLEGLAGLGFDAEWGLHSAAAVGAPHLRQRFWLLAHTDRNGLQRLRWRDIERRDVYGSGGADVAHPESGGRQSGQRDAIQPGRPGQRAGTVEGAGEDVADTENDRRPQWDAGGPRAALAETVGRRFPPPPDDTDGWQQWIAEGGPQPQIRRRADGRPVGLADALHLGGNGLVPAVAAHALLRLAERAGISLT